MRPRQMALGLEGGGDGHLPLVYLACRLTHVTDDQRKLLDSWCTHVESAVTDAASGSSDRWEVGVHAPLMWSAPWNDDRPDEDVYKLNSATVARCAAVIVLCIDGGGFGVGQEFAWALALRVPVLLLFPDDKPPSRQALGSPGDITAVGFRDATHLAEEVRSFLRANRSVIEDWRRRSESLLVATLPLRETLAERWSTLGERDRRRVEAEARVHRRRIAQLIDDDHALAGASMSEIFAIVGAMNIDIATLFAPAMPDLNARQRDALAAASDEYEWSGTQVLALETRARLELARGGTRRLSLVTPADWVQFREQTIDG